MDRVNLHSFYELGYLIHPVIAWQKAMSRATFGYSTFDLRKSLKALLDGKPVELRNKKPIRNFLKAIEDALDEGSLNKEDPDEWFNTEIEQYEIRQIATLASNLEVVLSNDFPLCHSYLIFEHGLHSVDKLIQHPEDGFSKEVVNRLEKMDGKPLEDFKESARCLAFGFSTACGFHICRATEAVLRNWLMIVDTSAQFDTRWKECVEKLQKKNKSESDPKIQKAVGMTLKGLDDLREDRRNPLMHPETSLNENEAEIFFDRVKSDMALAMNQICHLQPSP